MMYFLRQLILHGSNKQKHLKIKYILSLKHVFMPIRCDMKKKIHMASTMV